MAELRPPPQDPSALTAIAVNALREEVRRDIASVKELLQAENKHLKELHETKFAAQDRALAAALATAEAAGSKSEKGLTKQVDQLGELVSTKNDAQSQKTDDLRTRVGNIESRGSGIGQSASVLGIVLTIVIAAGAVLVAFLRH
jgi:hypothetical protein